jgi:hypothetical protein
MYGVKIADNAEFNEAYDEVYDDTDTPTVILDCYSGEYIILGKILYDSGDLRWEESGDSFVEIDLDSLPDIEKDYKTSFIDKFPQFASLLDAPFKLMTFVHYS